jgi:hypothetical protein
MYSYEIVGLVLLGFFGLVVSLSIITNMSKEEDNA